MCNVRPILVMSSMLFVAMMPAPARAQTTQPARPNIVMFIADDLSLKDIGPYGNTEIPTPNMDAMAKAGTTFDRAYATSPTCAPSRAALLTSRYNINTGAMFNHQKVKPEIKKWPAYFQRLGYEVVAIGKVSHYNQVKDYGFDYAAFFNYHEDVCIDEAAKWLAARKSEKPLCLLVGTNFPHVPWPQESTFDADKLTLPAKNADTPRTRVMRTKYAAAVARADSDLGEIRTATKDHLPGDTIFIFSADQGSQWPFSKWNLYDAGLHVPLIVDWPGHVEANKRTSAMVSWIDVMPTLLEVAGADLKSAVPDIDGRSFLPVLEGKASDARDRVFASHSGDGSVNYYPCRSVLLGNWKYIRNLDPKLEWHSHVDLKQADTGYFGSWIKKAKTDPATAAILERYYHRPAEELYDLATDPDELTNLATDPAHVGDLDKTRAALDEWMHANHDGGIKSDEAVKPKNNTNE